MTSVPSQHLLCHVMLKLLAFHSLITRLQQHCVACVPPLAQLISQTYFMPFALTANAIVARVFAVTNHTIPCIERSWSLMAVAFARAPPHSSPSQRSNAVLITALPVITAPLARVHAAAMSQLGSNPARHSTFANDIEPDNSSHSNDLGGGCTGPAASSNACLLRDSTACGAATSFSHDDLGVAIGGAKKSRASKAFKALLRQQRS